MFSLASLGSWLPFVIVAAFIVFFSITFTLRYQQKRERDYKLTIVCTISLIIALLTASLLPTDVILVSFMKNPNGTFKDWAQNGTDRTEIQNYVELSYYILYGLVLLMTFLVNPFLFFYYEEKRLCAALKWTCGFLVVFLILILLGVFIPQIVHLPDTNSTANDWEHVKYIFDNFDSSRLQDSISFAIFTLSIIGFILLTIYTSYGSIAFPISLIRGKRSAAAQQQEIEAERDSIKAKIDAIKTQYPRRALMPKAKQTELSVLEEKQAALAINEDSIRVVRQSFFYKLRFLYRPLQIIFGIVFILLALLIFISLLLSNIDKVIHFTDFKNIFAVAKNHTLPNPIDIILSWTGKFYPVNYVFLSALLIYIIFTSMFGLQQLGIWYFCIRMYRFSRKRSKPQALILVSSLMMFIVVAINIFVYLLIPRYAIYGDQDFITNSTATIEKCSADQGDDICQMTVMGRILLRFFYKVWVFAASFFCLSWLFLLIFLVSFLVKIIRKGESNIRRFDFEDLLEEESDDDLDETRNLIQ